MKKLFLLLAAILSLQCAMDPFAAVRNGAECSLLCERRNRYV